MNRSTRITTGTEGNSMSESEEQPLEQLKCLLLGHRPSVTGETKLGDYIEVELTCDRCGNTDTNILEHNELR